MEPLTNGQREWLRQARSKQGQPDNCDSYGPLEYTRGRRRTRSPSPKTHHRPPSPRYRRRSASRGYRRQSALRGPRRSRSPINEASTHHQPPYVSRMGGPAQRIWGNTQAPQYPFPGESRNHTLDLQGRSEQEIQPSRSNSLLEHHRLEGTLWNRLSTRLPPIPFISRLPYEVLSEPTGQGLSEQAAPSNENENPPLLRTNNRPIDLQSCPRCYLLHNCYPIPSQYEFTGK